MANSAMNVTWAQQSSNKDIFNSTQIGAGIPYQGPVTSSQLNGAVAWISQFIAEQQTSGGYFSYDKIYSQGDVCCILRKTSFEGMQIEFYMCSSPTPIQNHPPVIGAVLTQALNVTSFSGGTIDSVNWVRVGGNVPTAKSLKITSPTSDGEYIKFCTLNPALLNGVELEGDNLVWDIGGRFQFTVSCPGIIFAFEVLLHSSYVGGDIKTYLGNDYGDKIPSIFIKNVRMISNGERDTDEDAARLANLDFYGLKFIVGTETSGDSSTSPAIYIQTRPDIASINCSAYSLSGIVVSTGSRVRNVNELMQIPVLDGMGYQKDVGQMFECDFQPSALDIYNWGAIDITYGSDLSGPKYGLFNRKFTRNSDIVHEGRHTRVGGYDVTKYLTNLKNTPVGTTINPGLPNIWGAFWVNALGGSNGNGAIYYRDAGGRPQGSMVSGGKEYYFEAKRCSNLYGAAPSNDVRVASIIVKRFLRVFK